MVMCLDGSNRALLRQKANLTLFLSTDLVVLAIIFIRTLTILYLCNNSIHLTYYQIEKITNQNLMFEFKSLNLFRPLINMPADLTLLIYILVGSLS